MGLFIHFYCNVICFSLLKSHGEAHSRRPGGALDSSSDDESAVGVARRASHAAPFRAMAGEILNSLTQVNCLKHLVIYGGLEIRRGSRNYCEGNQDFFLHVNGPLIFN